MPIAVFLNEKPVACAAGDTLGKLIAEHAPDLLKPMLDGSAIATDGRAISISFDSVVYPGAIYLVRVSARGTRA